MIESKYTNITPGSSGWASQKRVELLSPAGDPEGFYGAIHAGADAVYLGGTQFGARAYAQNFSKEELIACIKYAHLWHRKVYLTVNTLVKDKEIPDLVPYLTPYYEAGLDGVIIQDIGVFEVIRKAFPGLELHVSTQMTVTGVHAARLLKEMGASRIVPARELSLKEIAHLKQDTGLEMETFIHGAMCYCYSGQCLFSSLLGGRSGNRGRCAQPCRLPYTVSFGKQSTKECFPLSLKDMCTIEHLPQLIEAGIDSFKIEGRMKKPEYTAGVTAIYRKYIDAYYTNPSRPMKIVPEDKKALYSLYIRTKNQDGYYFKHNGADMVTLESPAYSGSDEALLSQIRQKYLGQKLHKKVSLYGSFPVDSPCELTMLCEDFSITVTGDTVLAAKNAPVTWEALEKQLKKLGDTVFEAESIELTLSDNAFLPMKAVNELRRKAVAALEEAMLSTERKDQTQQAETKVGTTRLSISAAKAYTLPASYSVSIETKEQLLALLPLADRFCRFYLPAELLLLEKKLSETVCTLSEKTAVFLTLPYILRDADATYLKQVLSLLENLPFAGCMVRSMEGYAFLVQSHYTGQIASDAGFYVWNQETYAFWKDRLTSFCLPLELNQGETRQLLKETSQASVSNTSSEKGGQCALHKEAAETFWCFPEKYVYGYLPMMQTANCVVKTAFGCQAGKTSSHFASKDSISGNAPLRAFLTDRYQKRFPVLADCRHCINILYNSVPLSLHGKAWLGPEGLYQNTVLKRLSFTIEDERSTQRTAEFFLSLSKETKAGGSPSAPPFKDYTTGHEKRGVE